MQEGLSPAASEPLEALLPAENDVQVKTSVEPKERTPQTRPRIETWPLARPGQKVFPIPGEEGLVVNKDPGAAHSIYQFYAGPRWLLSTLSSAGSPPSPLTSFQVQEAHQVPRNGNR